MCLCAVGVYYSHHLRTSRRSSNVHLRRQEVDSGGWVNNTRKSRGTARSTVTETGEKYMSVKESWTERLRKREGNRRRRDRVEWRGLAGSQFSNQGSWHEGEPTGGQWDFYFSPLLRYAGALPSPLPHPPWIKIPLCAAVTEFIKHLHVLSSGRTTLVRSFLSPAYTHSTRPLLLSRFHCSLNWPSSTCVASTVVFFPPMLCSGWYCEHNFAKNDPKVYLSLASGCHMGSLNVGGGVWSGGHGRFIRWQLGNFAGINNKRGCEILLKHERMQHCSGYQLYQ